MPTSSETTYQHATADRYDYKEGDSENDFIKRNALRSDDAYFRMHSPIYAIATALRGKGAYKRARARYERAMAERAKAERARDYYGKMAQLDQMQGQEDDVRNDALAAVDDPEMIANDDAEIEAGYQGDIGNRYAGLAEDYGRESQHQGLAAARRGVTGGSNDAEQVADLASGFQSKLMDASQAALGRSANDYRSRADSRSSLRRSILAPDAASAASWTERSRAEGAKGERESRMMDYYNAFNGLKQQQAEDNSRLIGGAASAIGTSYRTDQDAKANGGVGLY